MRDVADKIKSLLIKTIQSELETTDKIAIPFSGSLDSSLIAYIVINFTNTKPILYTIGYPGCYDFKVSKKSSALLKHIHKHKLIHLHKHKRKHLHKQFPLQSNKLLHNLKEYLKLTDDKNKVSISYTLPFYILLKQIPQKYVITGHGADTLFGGFHKYLSSKNLKADIRKQYREFKSMIPKREKKIAEHFGKKLIMPFANEKLAEAVMKLPEECFIKNGKRKVLLRRIAKDLGMQEEIYNQPKKAFQYSTGIMKKLRKIWNRK